MSDGDLYEQLFNEEMNEFRYPEVTALEQDVQEHGEVHATIEEHEKEVEIRQGTTEFDYDSGVLRFETNDEPRVVAMDRVVSWYKPMEFYH